MPWGEANFGRGHRSLGHGRKRRGRATDRRRQCWWPERRRTGRSPAFNQLSSHCPPSFLFQAPVPAKSRLLLLRPLSSFLSMDQHPMQEDSSISAPTYSFYPTEQDPSSYNLAAYNGHMPPYQVVHPNPPQRVFLSFSTTRALDLIIFSFHTGQQQLVPDLQSAGLHPYPTIPLIPHQFHHANVYSSSPPHGPLPLSNSPPPPSPPEMYDPLSPPISGSDTSADGLYHHSNHSNSSSINSPAPSRANSLVHRTNVRYNPTPSPTSSSGRRRSRSRDSDEEDPMGLAAYNHPTVENLAHTRKEATRRQRIEAEQRRRDELRDGYAKLKDVLPVSNQKSSKVSLLERG